MTLTRIIINEDQFLVKQKDLLSAWIISPKFWAPGQIAAHFTVSADTRTSAFSALYASRTTLQR